VIEVLMVDDDEGDTLMAQEAFEDIGFPHNFHIVHDGIQALDFMEKKGEFVDAPDPDFVLLDINMPRMNGHEVLDWIRHHHKYELIPVVILTTSHSDEDIFKSYKGRANSFVTKPTDIREFNNAVRAIREFWFSVARLPTLKK